MDQHENSEDRRAALMAALRGATPSGRLQAALLAGTEPDPGLLATLIERCGVEPDFFRPRDPDLGAHSTAPHPGRPRPPQAVGRPAPAGSQPGAAHLVQARRPASMGVGVPLLVNDPDDEVARTAWRVAVGVVPRGEEAHLTGTLLRHLGRGDADVKKSLSRALIELALLDESLEPALIRARDTLLAEQRAHAGATLTLLADPGASFDGAYADARRKAGLAPLPGGASPTSR
ncbi:HEAT repeat domain-containing protein [Propioniciclava flava]